MTGSRADRIEGEAKFCQVAFNAFRDFLGHFKEVLGIVSDCNGAPKFGTADAINQIAPEIGAQGK